MRGIAGKADYERVEVASRGDLRAWLAAHHEQPVGAWIVTFKKSDPGGRYLPYDEIVEEALCFGWVDAQAQGLDEHRTMLLLAPRRPGSRWARTNKARVARLEAEGRMTDAGRAAIERAQADGSWTVLEDVENLVEPPELAAALDAEPAARRHWDAFPRSAKYAALLWLLDAKRPATREKRIREIAEKAAVDVRPR